MADRYFHYRTILQTSAVWYNENDVIKKIDLKRVEKNGVITEKNDLSSGIINKHFHPVYPLHFKFNVVIDGKTYEIDTSDVQISDKEDE